MPVVLAARVRWAAHSRTWATEPGAEDSWSEYNGLYGVDDDHGRLGGLHGGEDFLQLDLGQHVDLAGLQPQAARAQRDLGTAFLARDIQRGQADAVQRVHGLQQQGGLADAGIATNQHHAAFDNAAAQHAVQLLDAAGRARHVLGLDGRQRHHGLDIGQARIALGWLSRFLARARKARQRPRSESSRPRRPGTCPASAGWCLRRHSR